VKLTRLETRWARAAMEAFAPAEGGKVDHVAMLERIMRASTRRAALGLRLAIWLVAMAPLWLVGSLRTIVGVPLERRARILGRLLTHRVFAVRELTLLLKLNAAFALLHDAGVRARSGYDGQPRRLPLRVLGQESA
jgi:hypothetical protein